MRFEVPRGESLLQIVRPMPALDDRFCTPAMSARAVAAVHRERLKWRRRMAKRRPIE